MENVSFFNGFRDCTPYEKSLNSIVQLILSDEALRNLTETHRYYLSQNLTRKADHLKSSVGCFAVAVRFEGGKSQTHISDWTGLGIVDVDDLPPERMQELFRKVCDDPHTLLAYVTLSGHGLRIVFRYDIRSQRRLNDRQRASFYSKVVFEQGNRHFGELLGFPTDTKCRNCTRLSGLAYDPHACYRPAAEPFVFDDDSLNAFFRPARRGKVSLKTAVLAAEQQLEQEEIRFEAGMHNRYVMRMGYLLNAYGVDLDTALDWAIGRFSDEYEGDIAAIFRSCYQHTEEHGTQRIPRRKAEHQNETWASVEKVESFLEAQMHLRFNVVKHQCEYCWKREEGHTPRHEDFVPLTDRDENTVWCRMNKNGQKARLQDIRNVLHSEFVPLFNPFTEYFRSLPAWDGVTDYIGQLARTVHVKGDQERFVEYFRKWFVGILPALFEEQVVNHEIMVFIGRQGNYKSTFFSLLLPPPLQPYFHVKMNNNHLTKDDLLTLSEFALVCLEEIDELKPSELNQLKAMVTAKSISERAAYARNKERRPHIASFCGTGNNPHFLSDPTDNRRWLVVEVEDIDSPYDHPFNYTGIYSQAWALWKGGFRYWFDQREIRELNQQNREFEVPNLEQELVLTYFRPTFPGCKATFMSLANILERINGGIRHPLSSVKLGIIMKKCGFTSFRYNNLRGYLVVERSADEIKADRIRAAAGQKEEEQ